MNDYHIPQWVKSTSEKIISFLGSNIDLFVYWGSEPADCLDNLRKAFSYQFSNGEKVFLIVFFESGYCELLKEFVVISSQATLYCHCINSEQIFFIAEILLKHLSLKSVDYGLVNEIYIQQTNQNQNYDEVDGVHKYD